MSNLILEPSYPGAIHMDRGQSKDFSLSESNHLTQDNLSRLYWAEEDEKREGVGK
jgi:hypothetical protein